MEDINFDKTAKTQRISTNEYANKNKKKKDNAFVTFVKEHKVLSSVIGAILLFLIAFGGTMLFINITNPKEVEIPNIVGLSRQEAEQKVKDAKLVFEVDSEEYNTQIEENHIVSQNPAYLEKYNKVKEGSTVKVVISKGTEKTTVPKVIGMKEDEAIKAIEEAKTKSRDCGRNK